MKSSKTETIWKKGQIIGGIYTFLSNHINKERNAKWNWETHENTRKN